MPLSDEEARLLHQLEQSLAAEDPDFASTLRGSKLLAKSRRLVGLAILGFAVGLAVLFAGVVVQRTWVGVAGFVMMIATAYLFVVVGRPGMSGGQADRARPAPPRSSFVDRMEERWQRRQEGDDR